MKYRIRVTDSFSKADIINKLKTTSIGEGETFEYGKEKEGWLVQIQNHGKAEYPDVTKYPHASPKISSQAWGRIWYDGKMVFNVSDKLNVVRSKMIDFLGSSVQDSKVKDKNELYTFKYNKKEFYVWENDLRAAKEGKERTVPVVSYKRNDGAIYMWFGLEDFPENIQKVIKKL